MKFVRNSLSRIIPSVVLIFSGFQLSVSVAVSYHSIDALTVYFGSQHKIVSSQVSCKWVPSRLVNT